MLHIYIQLFLFEADTKAFYHAFYVFIHFEPYSQKKSNFLYCNANEKNELNTSMYLLAIQRVKKGSKK